MEKIIHIDYMRCLKALLYKLPLAIAFAVFAGIVGAIVCFYVLEPNDQYTARASTYTRSTNEFGSAAEGVQYAELAKSLTVAERALEIMGNTTISHYDVYNMIEIQYDNESTYVNSSAVINIYATSSNQQLAIEVANAVANAFVDEVITIVGDETQIDVLDEASATSITYEAQKEFWLYTGITAAAALVLACLVVVVIEMLSLHLVMIADGTLYGKIDIIGVIPNNDDL